MILLVPVLRHSLHVVMALTERLPVAPVPEELLVSPVGYDVVDNCCFHVPAFFPALHAQRVGLQKLFPGFPPCCSVTSAGSRPYIFRMQSFVPVTVFLP